MRPPSTITKIHQDILCLLWAFILNATNINPQFASFANSIRSVDYLPTVSDWTPTASRQHFQTLTQFDVSVQHEQDVPGLQVSVDDLHFVQVVQSLQHLASHHFNLRLRQSTIQLWPRDEGVKKKKKNGEKNSGWGNSGPSNTLRTACTFHIGRTHCSHCKTKSLALISCVNPEKEKQEKVNRRESRQSLRDSVAGLLIPGHSSFDTAMLALPHRLYSAKSVFG